MLLSTGNPVSFSQARLSKVQRCLGIGLKDDSVNWKRLGMLGVGSESDAWMFLAVVQIL